MAKKSRAHVEAPALNSKKGFADGEALDGSINFLNLREANF
jgi:hypothetical protein